MNETRQLMFCLKMSPTPGKENKRLVWVSHEGSGGGWETDLSSHPSANAAKALAGDLVISDPALLSLHIEHPQYTGKTMWQFCVIRKRGTLWAETILHVLCVKKIVLPPLARYTSGQCLWLLVVCCWISVCP